MAYRDKGDPRLRFIQHRTNARRRGVPFRLTFEEWFGIWQASGHWDERGARRGKFVMSRPGDLGAYGVGNVVIVRQEQNHMEQLPPAMRGEDNPAFGRDYWAEASEGARAQRRAAVGAAFRGKPKPLAQRQAMAATATGRRRVYRNGRAAWAHAGDADFPTATAG